MFFCLAQKSEIQQEEVSSGVFCPADVAHDIFEGIVPVELAHCLNHLMSKKYFTLHSLNESILKFPYKWADKSNHPHAIPKAFMLRKTIGGNAHENWSLLRFLPFLVADLVPSNENVISDLKDIVDLVIAPVHTVQSLTFLEERICDPNAGCYLESNTT